jgi:hypothetical protein
VQSLLLFAGGQLLLEGGQLLLEGTQLLLLLLFPLPKKLMLFPKNLEIGQLPALLLLLLLLPPKNDMKFPKGFPFPLLLLKKRLASGQDADAVKPVLVTNNVKIMPVINVSLSDFFI